MRGGLLVVIDAFDESGGVGVGPVGMLFEIGSLVPGFIDRHPLPLERERRCGCPRIGFRSAATSEPSPGALWSGRT